MKITDNLKTFINGYSIEVTPSAVSKIDNLLLNKCQHKWIDDVIDGPFSSQNYCYCCKCFLRKKYHFLFRY